MTLQEIADMIDIMRQRDKQNGDLVTYSVYVEFKIYAHFKAKHDTDDPLSMEFLNNSTIAGAPVHRVTTKGHGVQIYGV